MLKPKVADYIVVGECPKCKGDEKGAKLYPLADYPQYAVCLVCDHIAPNPNETSNKTYKITSYSGSRCYQCESHRVYYERTIKGIKGVEEWRVCAECGDKYKKTTRGRLNYRHFFVLSLDEAYHMIISHERQKAEANRVAMLKDVVSILNVIKQQISEIEAHYNLITCRCGCGRVVHQSKTGRPKEFFGRNCKEKYYYNLKKQENNEVKERLAEDGEIYCRCGCGRVVSQPLNGKNKQFFNRNCKERVRSRLKQQKNAENSLIFDAEITP